MKLIVKILVFQLSLIPLLGQQVNLHGVAFYNVENLFDPTDDPKTFDDDYTPNGKQQWTMAKFNQKIEQLADVIAKIGLKETKNAPLLLGLSEIENWKVLKNLVAHPLLRKFDYGIVHFDSPDLRGIDVALLYQKALFIPEHAKKYPLVLYDGKTNQKRTTRDQLVVSGWLGNKQLFVLVNHWPSRRGGVKKSESGRMAAARLQRKIIDSIQTVDAHAKIICMGDFNDDPEDRSMQTLTIIKENSYIKNSVPLWNPMVELYRKGLGSLAYRDRWHLFDQILISMPLLYNNALFYLQTRIFMPDFLVTGSGKHKGYPLRTQSNSTPLTGYSDHFPVYVLLAERRNE